MMHTIEVSSFISIDHIWSRCQHCQSCSADMSFKGLEITGHNRGRAKEAEKNHRTIKSNHLVSIIQRSSAKNVEVLENSIVSMETLQLPLACWSKRWNWTRQKCREDLIWDGRKEMEKSKGESSNTWKTDSMNIDLGLRQYVFTLKCRLKMGMADEKHCSYLCWMHVPNLKFHVVICSITIYGLAGVQSCPLTSVSLETIHCILLVHL